MLCIAYVSDIDAWPASLDWVRLAVAFEAYTFMGLGVLLCLSTARSGGLAGGLLLLTVCACTDARSCARLHGLLAAAVADAAEAAAAAAG